MIPPTSIDGTDITGATIDGTDVTEITVDGQTVFTAEPQAPTPGLLHHWDFSAPSTTTSFVSNQAGGPDLTGSFAGFDTINGVQSGDFNGSQSVATPTSTISSLSTLATWVVFEIDVTSGTNPGIVGSVSFDSPNFFFASGVYRTFNGTPLDGGSVDTNPHIGLAQVDGGSDFIEIDGVNVASGNSGSNYPVDISVGGHDFLDRDFDGSVGEVLLYDHSASGYSKTDVFDYLDDVWGPF